MQQQQVRVPHLSNELIEKLDKDYPHKCPDHKMSEREIWMQVGARALVDKLKLHLQMDEEDTTEE